MPTTPRNARVLLKEGKAKVVKRTPFTIQLLYPTGEAKEEVSLGVDAGTKHIGISATTKKEVLLEVDVALRTDIMELLATRKAFRKNRRSRKTRYRKARFSNRKRHVGWLAPSIQHKIDGHVKIINLLYELLPITKLIVEVAQFDVQKLKNPDIFGTEYQQGEQAGFWNIREYILHRDKHCCQWCKGKTGDKILNIHHIETRKTGGDSPNNLITLCKTCHKRVHTESLENKLKRKFPTLQDATQMTVMRWFIFNALKESYPHVKLTYGYLTKQNRIENGLEKSHCVDARCISGNTLAKPTSEIYIVKQVRGSNRKLHKATILKGGVRKANKAQKYVYGYQLFDKVLYKGKECFVFARRTSGSFDVRLINGARLSAGVSYSASP